ncbi:hypothetical protein EOD42_08835 [Rhodovarius crocodyli]|uniref:Uncharacterized protein n=1 Tax=Rhodovarius crocodyli TaxID=1979269 RepID=A0A437MJW9_9PROT|nr:hypothetical protein [Rhodovarius crocodyli]RVT97885.1 hypothetical protein EOD42_08835 [Rhodovarius crocodyli]
MRQLLLIRGAMQTFPDMAQNGGFEGPPTIVQSLLCVTQHGNNGLLSVLHFVALILKKHLPNPVLSMPANDATRRKRSNLRLQHHSQVSEEVLPERHNFRWRIELRM